MKTKLLYTTLLSALVGVTALIENYISYRVIGFSGSGWLSDLIVTETIAIPFVYFLVSQRLDIGTARDALLVAQARQGELLDKLQLALGAAEAANAAKTTFLAMMSHEIRTPLNGVLGMAQAMDQDVLPPQQRERLGVIQESGAALLAILNDILDLSKIEAGHLEIERIDFDLGAVMRGAHAAFTQMANKKGVSFALDLGAAAGVYHGDPTRIRQILYNLISNAVKFTAQGEIRVSAERVGDHLILRVRDSGIGMSPEVLERLFSEFTQADASTNRHYGGTGLGLAICRRLAELMGGVITVESEVGRGSVFTLDIPTPFLAPPDSIDAETTAARPAIGSEGLKPIRVLAAEDNPINQLVLKALLHQFTPEIRMVGNGREAVDCWRSEAFDVILMDVQMPILDGPSACREIRRLEAEAGRERVPIIALTANAMAHQVKIYLDAGMDGHVAKPIEAADLLATIARVLEPANAAPGAGSEAGGRPHG